MLGKIQGILISYRQGYLPDALIFTAFDECSCPLHSASDDMLFGGFPVLRMKQISEGDGGHIAECRQRGNVKIVLIQVIFHV